MKKNWKHIWMLTVLLAAPMLATGSPAAPYQGGGYGGSPRGPMSPDGELKRMTKEFSLTADQQAKIKPILVDSDKKMQDVRDNPNADRQTMREKMMKIRQDANTHVRALLDDKQKEKFDKQEQDRQERMQNRRDGGPGGAGGDNPGGNPPTPQN